MRKARKEEIANLLLVSKRLLNPDMLLDEKLGDIEKHRADLAEAYKDLINDK